LCWDTDTRDFVVFESKQQQQARFTDPRLSPYATSSTNFDQRVSPIGNVPHKLRRGNNPKWSPRVVPLDASQDHDRGYYQLPVDVVWAPFFTNPSLTASTGPVLFDYLFPFYNLLAMFGLTDRSLLLTTLNEDCHVSDSGSTVSQSNCSANFEALLPTMKLAPGHAQLLQRTGSTLSFDSALPLSSRICARYGVAGMAGLTDHGIKSHGERGADYSFAQNVARGPMYFRFRQYVLENLGLDRETKPFEAKSSPRKMMLSVSASQKTGPHSFSQQQAALQQAFSPKELVLQEQHLSELTFRQRIELAVQTNFYISVVGSGAIPAFFMPRGSTLILYYNNDETVESVRRNATKPIMMDWDLWNNMSHLRVHWLPLRTMNKTGDLRVLVDLIRNEMDYLNDRASLDRHERTRPKSPVDGTFGGLDVQYVERSQASAVHCLGDNFVDKQAFCYRSCEIQHLCHEKESHFEVFSSPIQSELNTSLVQSHRDYAIVSTRMDTEVLEGRSIRFAENAWFPSVSELSMVSFYELPSDVVWIPFTLELSYAKNPGHLMWDFFLPFYTLLAMYGATDKRLLVTTLDSTCAFMRDCKKVVAKFLPLLGTNVQDFYKQRLRVSEGAPRTGKVCARQGAVGIGMLTDHGFTRHGQNVADYKRVHNAGRGPMFWDFRQWMLRNMKIEEGTRRPKPFRVSFSINSSNNPDRRKDFAQQIAAVRNEFSNKDVEVKVYEMAKLTLEEQIHEVVDTTIFVSAIGGSTSIASFLPRDSSLILFFNDQKSFVGGKTAKKNFPTMMDFDFWNNAAYVRTHWLPTGSMDEELGLQTLLRLVTNELILTHNMIE
jgi:hypothetical protein